MPSLAVQELLVEQERIRIEQLSRDAWKRNDLTPTPAGRRRLSLRRATADDRA